MTLREDKYMSIKDLLKNTKYSEEDLVIMLQSDEIRQLLRYGWLNPNLSSITGTDDNSHCMNLYYLVSEIQHLVAGTPE